MLAEKVIARLGRHRRVRKKVRGTAERPRLCVFRSNKHIYAQLIDDDRGITLFGFDSRKVPPEEVEGTGKVAVARATGRLLGKMALKRGITQVVFDRGGYKYHGRVKALADGAREAGLKF